MNKAAASPITPAMQAKAEAAVRHGVVCPHCGASNRSASRYCSACGGGLMASPESEAMALPGEDPFGFACPHCAVPNRLSDRRCRNCGGPLDAAGLVEAEPRGGPDPAFDFAQDLQPLQDADVGDPDVAEAPPTSARRRARLGLALGTIAVAFVASGLLLWRHQPDVRDTAAAIPTTAGPSPPAAAAAPRPSAVVAAPAASSSPPVTVQAALPPPQPTAAPAPPAASEAQASPTPVQLISNPAWTRRPNGRQVAKVLPSAARKNGVGGAATLECAVAAAGRLHNCSVVSERPSGYGFGRAALRLASTYRMKAKTRSGELAAGRRVRVQLRWRARG